MRKIIVLLPVILSLLMPSIVMAAPGSTGSDTAKLLAAVRKATYKYHDINAALADGYVFSLPGLPPEPCEENMGIHVGKLALLFDLVVNEFQPELLLYAPTDGGLKLVGVEYFMAAIGHNSTYAGPLWEMTPPEGWVWDTPSPPLFGTVMDGPMAPHELGVMPWHFDFHVYLWQANPNGIFAEWNPTVKC